jgi:hypothetical protein
MPRAPARFTQAELTRAAKAMQAAGCVVTGARIDRDGNIEVICSAAQTSAQSEPRIPQSLAEWRKERGHGAR